MMPLIDNILRSLCAAMVNDLPVPSSQRTVDSCCEFVIDVCRSMQYVSGKAVALASLWLNIAPLILSGKTFNSLNLEERTRVINRWRGSNCSIKRNYMKLVFILAITAFYDSEDTITALGMGRPAYLASLSFYDGSVADE